MTTVKTLMHQASQHHGSVTAVEQKLANAHRSTDLTTIPDDRWLAALTKSVFQAGFNWKVIEAKWPGFEAAFGGFDPHSVAFYTDEDLDRLVSDERVVRNGQKLKATIGNAQFVVETSRKHGGFGRFLANWPETDQAGLMAHLAKHGHRLGGMTAQYFLRYGGWDAFILSKDVTAALIRDGVIDKPVTSKAALNKVQVHFNQLREGSPLSQAELSRLMALSVG